MKLLAVGLVMVLVAGCAASPTPIAPTPAPPSPTRLAPSATVAAPVLTPSPINSPTSAPASSTTPALTAPPTTAAVATSTRAAVVPTATTLAPPAIITFTFAPALINPGEAVTLTWEVAGAEQVAINRILDYRLTLPTYEVPLVGSLVLTTYDHERTFANFVLFAVAGDQSAQANVIIPIRCPDTWFFADPPPDCPYAAVNTNWVAQDFENGRLLWAENGDRIYRLYAGGSRWGVNANAWFEGMPESDPTLIPPPGYFQPVRGFGLVWRDEQMPEGLRVRDEFGWATNAEYGWGAGAVQCTAVTKYSTCYLGGPAGVIYRLEPEGSGWDIWSGPP